ncbi:MAG: prolyl aminopeptidase [Gammaproteobacteria bacterium]|nr:MAG: prolyl aminopeptidase [Gammaproteobacteria bacterium]
MHQLFSPIEPYATHTIEVSDGHRLYVEECGTPEGIPVVFVHGGPGAGCENYHRRFFDPAIYRIILFDQRGCGRSVPHAALEGNATGQLVGDMETIRVQLGVEQWVVFGGSWGSTLGLVYAETHPSRVLGLILRGIFLCRPRDIHWFYQEGASFLLPDYWHDYLQPIPEDERSNLVEAYYRRLTGNDELVRMAAAKSWSLWEGRASTLLPRASVVDHFANPHTALSLARIECHYFMHDSFLEPDQILNDAGRLQDIPGVIVHGRYDVVCPIEQAWELHKAWPNARLQIIPDAGHSATEPGIVNALMTATRQFAMRFR